MCQYRQISLAAFLTCLMLSDAVAEEPARRAADLQKQRADVEEQRSRILSKMGLANAPEQELRNLAAAQKKELEAARDDCRKTQQAAIEALGASAFRELIAAQNRRSREQLKTRAEQRREMIAKNNEVIQNNKLKIEYCERQVRDGQAWANRESLKSAYDLAKGSQKELLQKQLGAENSRIAHAESAMREAIQQNEALTKRNDAAQSAYTAIERSLQPGTTPGEIAQAMAVLRDAAMQEKNTWDATLTDWQKENDWARRVAAELFLGMDPAIAMGNNPEMILAELSPVFNEKLMRERAEMYDQMAKGVDEALGNLLGQAAEYKAALPQLESQLKELDGQLNTLDDALAQARAEVIVPRLPRGMVNDGVLQRWMIGNKVISGFPVDSRLVQATVKEFRKARQNRMARVSALLANLAGKRVQLNCVPQSPITWLPGAKKIDVTVAVLDGGLSESLLELNDLVKRLTGLLPTVTVTDRWTFRDKTYTTNLSETSEKVFSFDKPETHFVQVLRNIKVSVDVPPRHTCPIDVSSALSQRLAMEAGRIKIEVKLGDAPNEIAGRWFGNLTVQTFVIEGGPGQQGCDLSSKLAGKPIPLILDVQGPVASGRAVMTAKPPAGQGEDVVAQLNYTTNGAALTAQGAYQGGTMTLNGRFTPTAAGWSLGGTWSWAGVSDQNKGRASGGFSLAPPKSLAPR